MSLGFYQLWELCAAFFASLTTTVGTQNITRGPRSSFDSWEECSLSSNPPPDTFTAASASGRHQGERLRKARHTRDYASALPLAPQQLCSDKTVSLGSRTPQGGQEGQLRWACPSYVGVPQILTNTPKRCLQEAETNKHCLLRADRTLPT